MNNKLIIIGVSFLIICLIFYILYNLYFTYLKSKGLVYKSISKVNIVSEKNIEYKREKEKSLLMDI